MTTTGSSEPLLEKAEISSPRSPGMKKGSIAKLPDLTERLAAAGLLEDYRKFRERYMVWRSGGAQGAAGELVVDQGLHDVAQNVQEVNEQLEAKTTLIFDLYGGEKNFNWQKTFSYWVAVLFMIGCWLFVFTSFVPCIPEYWPAEWKVVVQMQWIGNLFFTGGISLMWFTVANVKQVAEDGIIWNPFQASRVKAHLAKVLDSEGEQTLWGTSMPYYIAINYMLGGVLYNVCTLVELFEGWTPVQKYWLVTMPTLWGGFLFFTGGALEVLGCMYIVKEGTSWFSPKRWDICPLDHEKCSTVINMVGGFLFFFPCALEQLPFVYGENERAKKWWTGFQFTIGSALYVLGCVIQVFLWKGDSFGMSYFHQLNRVNQKAGNDGKRKEFKLGFSYRGTIMVCLSSLFSAVAVFNVGMHYQNVTMGEWNEDEEHWNRINIFFRFLRDGLPFVLFILQLVLISAAVNLPSEQPYRGLMVACRILTCLLGVYLLLDYIDVYERLMCKSGHQEWCDYFFLSSTTTESFTTTLPADSTTTVNVTDALDMMLS